VKKRVVIIAKGKTRTVLEEKFLGFIDSFFVFLQRCKIGGGQRCRNGDHILLAVLTAEIVSVTVAITL